MYSATAKSHGDKFRAGTIDSLRYQASLIASGRYEHPVVGRATFASSGRRRVPSSRRSKKAVPLQPYAVNHLGAYAVYDESDSSDDDDKKKDPKAGADPKPGVPDKVPEPKVEKKGGQEDSGANPKDAEIEKVIADIKEKYEDQKTGTNVLHVKSRIDKYKLTGFAKKNLLLLALAGEKEVGDTVKPAAKSDSDIEVILKSLTLGGKDHVKEAAEEINVIAGYIETLENSDVKNKGDVLGRLKAIQDP